MTPDERRREWRTRIPCQGNHTRAGLRAELLALIISQPGWPAGYIEQLPSDVDLLVAPGPDTTLFDLSGFALDVEEIVGRHVDVATPRGLKARIRDRVLAEAVAL